MMTITQIRSKAKDSADVIWRNRLMVVIVFVLLVAVAVFALSFLQKNYVAGANLLVVNGTTRDDPTLSSPDLPSAAAPCS